MESKWKVKNYLVAIKRNGHFDAEETNVAHIAFRGELLNQRDLFFIFLRGYAAVFLSAPKSWALHQNLQTCPKCCSSAPNPHTPAPKFINLAPKSAPPCRRCPDEISSKTAMLCRLAYIQNQCFFVYYNLFHFLTFRLSYVGTGILAI